MLQKLLIAIKNIGKIIRYKIKQKDKEYYNYNKEYIIERTKEIYGRK
jgi:hypothetical protein